MRVNRWRGQVKNDAWNSIVMTPTVKEEFGTLKLLPSEEGTTSKSSRAGTWKPWP
jgi:hypothetical protein